MHCQAAQNNADMLTTQHSVFECLDTYLWPLRPPHMAAPLRAVKEVLIYNGSSDMFHVICDTLA